MDPDTTVDEMRELAKALMDGSADTASAAVELAEKFQALDGWLLKGGFLPDEWKSSSY